MKVVIRQAGETDLASVYEMERKIFTPINYPMFVLRQFFDLMPELFLVAEGEGGEILGYTQGGINQEQRKGWILSLAIRKENRGMGIGRMLSQDVIRRLRSKNVTKICLTVHPDNSSAKHLYEDLGFYVHEKIKDYYGDGEPRLVMDLKVIN